MTQGSARPLTHIAPFRCDFSAKIYHSVSLGNIIYTGTLSKINLSCMVKMNNKKLKQEINKIKKRNLRVEADKTWETSYFRKFLVALLTYIVIVSFFLVAELPKPYINSIIPTLGFLVSTLTVPVFKKFWKRYFYQNK